MSIFKRLRREIASPTREWLEDRAVPLIANLDEFSLNEVGFGDPVEKLSFLGPSQHGYAFPAKGLVLSVDDGLLDGFFLATSSVALDLFPADVETIRPFPGIIRAGRRDWRPGELSRESHFVGLWDDPYWRDVDEDEVLLFFEFPGREIQVELTRRGRAKGLIASTPLLADPEQRAAYGVTKPWPP